MRNRQNLAPGFPSGISLLILLFAVFLITIGLTIAFPVWETQIRREKEIELIHRGNQYVEAIRLFQKKNPGKFPSSLEDLLQDKYLRRLFPDPMTSDGAWNLILVPPPPSPGTRRSNSTAPQVMIAPQGALASIESPRIIGVVSSSPQASFRLYLKQNTYDHWLFFLGLDPDNFPEIIIYGEGKSE